MVNRGELLTDQPWELVDGEILWLTASKARESQTCVRILMALGAFATRIGATLFDSSAGFMVGERHQQLRCPDVSLVTAARAHLINPEGWIAAAPDLAAEVLSQGEYGEAYARTKVPEYLSAGGTVVWLADPRRRTIREYVAGHAEFVTYRPEEVINLDAVAPGFEVKVADIFPG